MYDVTENWGEAFGAPCCQRQYEPEVEDDEDPNENTEPKEKEIDEKEF